MKKYILLIGYLIMFITTAKAVPLTNNISASKDAAASTNNQWLNEMSDRLMRQFGANSPQLMEKNFREQLLETVRYEAARAELDPQLVLSLITVESRFNTFAVSKSGAVGIMQVMPFWKKHIGTNYQDLFDMQTNIRYGCSILRHYLQLEHGNIYYALGRYNGSRGSSKYPTLVLNSYKHYWQI